MTTSVGVCSADQSFPIPCRRPTPAQRIPGHFALGINPLAHPLFPPEQPRFSDQRLQINFPRARSDLYYSVEGSFDLAAWSTIETNLGNVGEIVTVADTITLSPNIPRRFLRLRVFKP
jgi:hypothetical protein